MVEDENIIIILLLFPQAFFPNVVKHWHLAVCLIGSANSSINFPFKYVETNQQKIVQAGGLTSLLILLGSSEDETIHRVAAGAIANLAMNGNVHITCIICSYGCSS